MDFTLKRILTMKSKIGRGTYPNETIERLIESDNAVYIRWVYYHFQEIDFIPEVKKAVHIIEEIQKPGVDDETFWRNERALWAKQRADMGDEAYMRLVQHNRKTRNWNKSEKARSQIFGRSMSKGALQAVNHGRSKIKGM